MRCVVNFEFLESKIIFFMENSDFQRKDVFFKKMSHCIDRHKAMKFNNNNLLKLFDLINEMIVLYYFSDKSRHGEIFVTYEYVFPEKVKGEKEKSIDLLCEVDEKKIWIDIKTVRPKKIISLDDQKVSLAQYQNFVEESLPDNHRYTSDPVSHTYLKNSYRKALCRLSELESKIERYGLNNDLNCIAICSENGNLPSDHLGDIAAFYYSGKFDPSDPFQKIARDRFQLNPFKRTISNIIHFNIDLYNLINENVPLRECFKVESFNK